MYSKATLDQALTKADNLIEEWQRLRRDIGRQASAHLSPSRMGALALRQLETEIGDTLGSVRYRREQEQIDKDDKEREERAEEERTARQHDQQLVPRRAGMPSRPADTS